MKQLTEQSTDVEKVLMQGDLSSLSPNQKLSYYKNVCDSLGLNSLTKPFEYIRLNGKEVLYATRACTEQLRTIHNVSLMIASRETIEGVYVVTARATMPSGRTDESTGAVTITGLKGDNLANAFMKCETKAKRRVTLSICGLGLLDESEVDSIPNAQIIRSHAIELGVDATPSPSFKAPEVTSQMKAMFIKNEAQQVREQMQSTKLYHTDPSPSFEFTDQGDAETAGNFVKMFGKRKGETLSQIGVEEVGKAIWGAEKALSEGEDWVDKVGVDNVELFIKQAKSYINGA